MAVQETSKKKAVTELATTFKSWHFGTFLITFRSRLDHFSRSSSDSSGVLSSGKAALIGMAEKKAAE